MRVPRIECKGSADETERVGPLATPTAPVQGLGHEQRRVVVASESSDFLTLVAPVYFYTAGLAFSLFSLGRLIASDSFHTRGA